MSTADLDDIQLMAAKDRDVKVLLTALRTVLSKHGASLTMRMVAFVLAPYKRQRFEQMLGVKESHAMVAGLPSDLTGKEVSPNIVPRHMGLDHNILWLHEGKRMYLTSEPQSISKEQLRALIAHCDEHGIDFQVDAEASYYPGRMIRILFKKGTVTQYDALQQGTREPRG